MSTMKSHLSISRCSLLALQQCISTASMGIIILQVKLKEIMNKIFKWPCIIIFSSTSFTDQCIGNLPQQTMTMFLAVNVEFSMWGILSYFYLIRNVPEQKSRNDYAVIKRHCACWLHKNEDGNIKVTSETFHVRFRSLHQMKEEILSHMNTTEIYERTWVKSQHVCLPSMYICVTDSAH